MTNYPNDPNQPGGYGEQKPGDQPQYGQGQPGQYGTPQGGYPPADGGYGGQPAPAGYGGQPQQEYPRSTLILVLGILGVLCFIPGVVAIVMGRQALTAIDQSGGRYTGRGKVQAGFILGIIFTVLNVIGIIVRLTAN